MTAPVNTLIQSAKNHVPDFVRVGYRRVRSGISFIPRQLIGTITNVSTVEPIVALTFDDGPHPDFTPRLLDILGRHSARATFFVVGESAKKHPQLLRRIAEAGHAIGNHSWDHPSFPAIGRHERRRQMRACEEAIGPYSQKLFRPPFGNQIFASRLDALSFGYRVIAWNVVGNDWQDDSAEVIFSRLARGIQPGNILLLHDALFTFESERFASREATLAAVRMLLEKYSRTYRFVTVPELLRSGRPMKKWWYQPGDANYLANLRKSPDRTASYLRPEDFGGVGMPDAGEGEHGAEEKMKLSVVLPCYNAERTIAEQLEALAGQAWSEPWEVIVVNNRCTDGSMTVVQTYLRRMSNLHVVDALGKQGAAYAMNTGVRAARGELLAFCDADDVVGEGWIAAMGVALAKHDFISGPHELERLNPPMRLRNRSNPQRTGVQEYTDPPYLPHAGAGNMGVKRTVFEAIGGFDESMTALFDTDFCWRMQLSGVVLNPAPNAVLHVRYRDRVSSLIRQAMDYGEKNVFIYKRYRPYGMPKYPWKRSVRSWIDLISDVGALLKPKRRLSWLWNLGWYLGRLRGCIKYRVLAF